jgi:hypothetical protein
MEHVKTGRPVCLVLDARDVYAGLRLVPGEHFLLYPPGSLHYLRLTGWHPKNLFSCSPAILRTGALSTPYWPNLSS